MTDAIEALEALHDLQAQADDSIKMLANMAANVHTPPALAMQFTVAGELIKSQKTLLAKLFEQQMQMSDMLDKFKAKYNLN